MNVGQLVVSLISDDASFVAGMRRAERQVSTLEATVKRAQRQGIDPMAARMGQAAQGAMAWDAGMRRLAAQTATTVASTSRMATAVRNVEGSLGQAVGGANKLQSAFFRLGTAALGLPGPLGKVAEIGSIFAVGGGWAAAAAGGIALVAGAIKLIKEESQKALQPSLDLIEQWKQMTNQPLKEQLASSRKELERLRMLQGQLENQGLKGIPLFTPAERDEAGISIFDSPGTIRKKSRAWITAMIAQLSAARELVGIQPLADLVIHGAKETGTLVGSELANAWILSMEETLRRKNRLGSEWMESLVQRARETNLKIRELTVPTINLDRVLERTPIGRMRDQADLWKQAWKNAIESVQRSVADFFFNLFEKGNTFLGLLQQALKALARIAADLLGQQIIFAFGGLIPTGAGAGVQHGNGATGPSLRAGDTYNTYNIVNVSAIDAKSFADTMMANRHAAAMATARAMSESRGLSLQMRGW